MKNQIIALFVLTFVSIAQAETWYPVSSSASGAGAAATGFSQVSSEKIKCRTSAETNLVKEVLRPIMLGQRTPRVVRNVDLGRLGRASDDNFGAERARVNNEIEQDHEGEITYRFTTSRENGKTEFLYIDVPTDQSDKASVKIIEIEADGPDADREMDGTIRALCR